ncbi:MAG: hypothetical protein ACK47B_22485 [Armatimonadota bacterium]
MKRAEVLTEWVGSGESTGDPRRPRVIDVYPPRTWSDVTGQDGGALPPEPNAVVVVELVCDDAVLAALEADAAYAGAVLWSEDA